MNNKTGKLYVVATPIGNLDDMVPRAVEVLQSVDQIAAEDTRRTGQLCAHFGIRTKLTSYHDHNEEVGTQKLMKSLAAGQQIALVADAGMPLISDPGYRLLRSIRDQGYQVTVIPGPCAAITALAGSGLPSDRFQFLGFPPAKQNARRKWLEQFSQNIETLVVYESSHRILTTLSDCGEIFGDDRQVVLARELTKRYETWLYGTVAETFAQVSSDANQQKGEFVLVIAGAEQGADATDLEITRVMKVLLAELPIKKAAAVAAQLLEVNKKDCYEIGVSLRKRSG